MDLQVNMMKFTLNENSKGPLQCVAFDEIIHIKYCFLIPS